VSRSRVKFEGNRWVETVMVADVLLTAFGCLLGQIGDRQDFLESLL